MNYIIMINSFWALRRSCKITNLQADLYFFLLHESNSRNWQNPFYCSNQLVCASLGVTEKSVWEARKALAQLGLIEFENGITKSTPPKYLLLDYGNKVMNQGMNVERNQGMNVERNQGMNGERIEGNIIYKQNRNKTKLNKTKDSFADQGSADQKKCDSNWNLWVESWFKFYEQKNNSVSPNFAGAQTKALKEIKNFLEKNFQKKFPDEDCASGALDSWKYILDNHHKLDQWLQTQFDLTVIYKKMNDIMSQLLSGDRKNSNNEQQFTSENKSGTPTLREAVQQRIKERFGNSSNRPSSTTLREGFQERVKARFGNSSFK